MVETHKERYFVKRVCPGLAHVHVGQLLEYVYDGDDVEAARVLFILRQAADAPSDVGRGSRNVTWPL